MSAAGVMGCGQFGEAAILAGGRLESSVSIIVIGKGVWRYARPVPSIALFHTCIEGSPHAYRRSHPQPPRRQRL
ncbi:hypothetical protein PSEUDO9AZ_11532 [Pseudomonas sp. 9AZ]|nr:hypothetical protein PSEUDO9AZ_11532 [Pseudomonas sp. 9AZ]